MLVSAAARQPGNTAARYALTPGTRYVISRAASDIMSKELMVQGKPLNIGKLPSVREYVADKAGITLPAVVKGQPGITFKEVKELAIKAGHSADVVKAWGREYDGVRKQHYVESGMVVGMLAADPSIRKSVRLARNKDGDVIGANATFRKERSLSIGSATRIAQLEATIAALTLRLGTPA